MTIIFDYTVSCGLDGFMIELPELPTPEKAYQIIMDQCLRRNIDPYFALWATCWQEFGTKKAFALSQAFRDSMRSETEKCYAEQKEKYKLQRIS